jgi:hypothetical protein
MVIATPPVQAPPLTLDALAAMSAAELERRYRAAPAPTGVHALDGAPVGRMLAVRGLDAGVVARGLRRLAASEAFVWGGKSFASADDKHGAGINRLRVPGLLGRQDLFPFHTALGASALDGEPTIILDYDLPQNPPWIRRIHDEVREVEAGLFLGPAMWKRRGATALLLWFALDTRVQA